jgi:hypothetical protein
VLNEAAEFVESAKAADARPEAAKELGDCSRGAIDTAAVLRGFLNSGKRYATEVQADT